MMIGTKKVRQQMDRNCQSRAWQVVLHVGKIIKISLPFSYLWVIYQNTPEVIKPGYSSVALNLLQQWYSGFKKVEPFWCFAVYNIAM